MHFNRSHLVVSVATVALLSLMPATQAAAQEESASAVAEPAGDPSQDIIVTARKQAETVKDIPATVNVLAGEGLASRLMGSGLDLSGMVPGVQLYNALGGAASPTVRGLGSNTAVFSIEASVASFFDGVYAAHPRDLVSPTFDIERIEVIKGTQSTALGKNTTLGAISFVSRRPGDDFGFDLTLGHELKLDSTRIEGGLDIPVGDTLRVRLAGFYSHERGFIDNRLLDRREPTREFVGGRLVAVWKPTDALTATVIYQHDTYDEDGQSIHLIRDGGISALAAQIGQTPFAVGRGFSYNGYPLRPPYDRQNSDRATLIAEYELGNYTLTSQTAYVNWTERHRNDLDLTAGSLLTFEVEEPNELFSQELRLASPSDGPINYLAGLYYLWNKWGIDQTIDADAPWPRTGTVTHFYEQTVNAYSAFAQVNAKLTDQIKLSGGARFTRETKDARFSRIVLEPGSASTIFAPFAERRPSHNESNVDWSISAQYYLDQRNVFYVAAARGSKSGGFQTLPSNPNLAEFEGEQALTLETGVKLRPINGLSFDFALYETTVKDFQYNINTPAGNIITNAKVRSRGFDTSLNWRPMDGLRLEGGVVYADATIREAFPGAPKGTPVQRAPKWTGNAAIYFERDLSDAIDFTINPSLEFSSSQYNQLPSINAPKREAYGLVNLRLAVGDTDDKWEVAMIGKNLTNQRPLISATSSLLINGPFYGNLQPPATFTLQLTLRQ